MEARIKKLLQDGPKTFMQIHKSLYQKATSTQKEKLKRWLKYLETDASIEWVDGEYRLIRYDYDRRNYQNELNKEAKYENN